MVAMVGSERQQREHPVPCQKCGYRMRRGVLRPNVLTWNLSALCDKHQDDEFFKKIEEARNDFA